MGLLDFSLFGAGGSDVCVLDVGYHSVKVLVVKSGRKGGEVKRAYVRKTQLNPSVPPEETMDYLVHAISSLWSDEKLPRNVVTAIPGRTVFSRILKIPHVTGERLDRIVRYEAKQQILIPIEQTNLDYHVFQTEAGKELNVALLAVKRDIVEEHVALLRAAGLMPEVIDITTLALFNAQMDQPHETDLVTAAINVGASTTDIVIESGGGIKFMRTAPVAGNTLTTAIERELGVPFEEAENIKVTQGGVSYAPGAMGDLQQTVSEVLEHALERSIVSEIRKSIDYFISQPEGLTVNRVVITGGTSRLPGIEGFLEDRLGLPVEKGNPVLSTSLKCDALEENEDPEVFAVAVGLAQRTVRADSVKLNFTPPWIEERKELRARQGALIMQMLILGLIIGVSYFWATIELKNMDMAARWVDDIIRGTLGISLDLQNETAKMRALQDQFDKFRQINESRGRLLYGLQTVTDSMPPDTVWLTRVEPYSDNGLRIVGRSQGDGGMRDFLSNLRKSLYVTQPKLSRLEIPPGPDDPPDSVSFAITIEEITMVPPEWQAIVEPMSRVDNLRGYSVLPHSSRTGMVLRVRIYDNDDLGAQVIDILEIVGEAPEAGRILQYEIVVFDPLNNERKAVYIFNAEDAGKIALRVEGYSWEVWAPKNVRPPAELDRITSPGPRPGGQP